MLKEPSLHELQQQMTQLNSLLIACLTAFLLLSIVLTAFLSVQDYFLRRDLTGARKLVQEYETNRKPMINAFVAKLQAFAQNNPDFQPILQKYGIPLSVPVQTPQPATSTTPVR